MMVRPVVLLILIASGTLTEFVLEFGEIMKDKIIGEHDKSLLASVDLSCVFECYKNPPCLSFAYHNVSQQCYIYYRMLTDQDNTTDFDGWKIFTLKSGETNLALGKPTMISPNGTSWALRFPSNLAVDGNSSTFFLNDRYNSSWWCVDLEETYNITWIRFVRITHYNITVHISTEGCSLDVDMDVEPCYRYVGKYQRVHIVTACNHTNSSLSDVRSVYIRAIRGSRAVNLSLKEVEIYSRNGCSLP